MAEPYLGYANVGTAQIAVTLVTCGLGSSWGLVDAILSWPTRCRTRRVVRCATDRTRRGRLGVVSLNRV